jgi:hypothetical protein
MPYNGGVRSIMISRVPRFVMPNPRSTHRLKSSFNYMVFVDLIVVAGILVVASRPDGLAITISAAIVATAAGVYRCMVGVKSLLKPKSPGPVGRPTPDRAFKPPAPRSAAPRTPVSEKSNSWLRESD